MIKRSKKLRIVTFGWAIAHAAVSRRPPVFLSRIVARTHMNTHAAKVWDFPSFVDHFCRPVCQTLTYKIRNFLHRCTTP